MIVCTDGLANTGLGSLDGIAIALDISCPYELFLCMCVYTFSSEIKVEEAFSGAQQFYKDLGDIALEKG